MVQDSTFNYQTFQIHFNDDSWSEEKNGLLDFKPKWAGK